MVGTSATATSEETLRHGAGRASRPTHCLPCQGGGYAIAGPKAIPVIAVSAISVGNNPSRANNGRYEIGAMAQNRR
jgi:hypothetical protein